MVVGTKENRSDSRGCLIDTDRLIIETELKRSRISSYTRRIGVRFFVGQV